MDTSNKMTIYWIFEGVVLAHTYVYTRKFMLGRIFISVTISYITNTVLFPENIQKIYIKSK